MSDDYDWLAVCDDIDDGEYDDGLDRMAEAINSRRQVVSRRNARRLIRELKTGDRVIILDTISPRYYANMVGTVYKLEEGAASIKLDSLPTTRGRPPAEGRRSKLKVPYIHLMKLDPDDVRAQLPGKTIDPDEVGDDNEYEDDEVEDEVEDEV